MRVRVLASHAHEWPQRLRRCRPPRLGGGVAGGAEAPLATQCCALHASLATHVGRGSWSPPPPWCPACVLLLLLSPPLIHP